MESKFDKIIEPKRRQPSCILRQNIYSNLQCFYSLGGIFRGLEINTRLIFTQPIYIANVCLENKGVPSVIS